MIASKRKAIEKGILDFVTPITPGGNNRKVYEDLFKQADDKTFEVIWEGIKEKGYIPLFFDNYDNEEMVDYNKLLDLAKSWDIPLEQKLVIPDPDTGITYTTAETVLVGICEVAKPRQLSIKKIGVSKNDYQVATLTGQPIGDSKAGGISNPELNILVSLGLTTVAKELASVKGGDVGAYRHYKSSLSTTGNTQTKESLQQGTGVKSLKTVKWLLAGRHILSDIN